MLTSACCGCIAAAQQQQIYSAKTKYINIVMYIIMQITQRVVMTEIQTDASHHILQILQMACFETLLMIYGDK